MDGRSFPAVLQHGDEVVARLELQLVEALDQCGNLPKPSGIGQSHVAVDDGERLRVARHAGEKAGAEVKHFVLPRAAAAPRRARRPRSARSRYIGTDARSERS